MEHKFFAPSKFSIATGQNKDCGIQTLDISAKLDSDQQQLLAELTATHMYNTEMEQTSCAMWFWSFVPLNHTGSLLLSDDDDDDDDEHLNPYVVFGIDPDG